MPTMIKKPSMQQTEILSTTIPSVSNAAGNHAAGKGHLSKQTNKIISEYRPVKRASLD